MPHEAPPRGGSLVSVCIPSFNAAPFILDTLRSVLRSHHQALDVVVSDDASSDGTAEIAASLGDPRVRVFTHPTRVGPAANWNRALAHARGELIGLLNHDDLYGPFWLSSAVAALKRCPRAGWAASAYKVVDVQGRTRYTSACFPATGVYEGKVAFMTVARLRGLGPGFLARRQVLQDVGGYDELAGASADTDLFLRLASCSPLFYSAFPHNAWRLHDTNLTHSWGLPAQAGEGARMLAKAFTDPRRPAWVDACREGCLAFFLRSSRRVVEILAGQGRADEARQVLAAVAPLERLLAGAPPATQADGPVTPREEPAERGGRRDPRPPRDDQDCRG